MRKRIKFSLFKTSLASSGNETIDCCEGTFFVTLFTKIRLFFSPLLFFLVLSFTSRSVRPVFFSVLNPKIPPKDNSLSWRNKKLNCFKFIPAAVASIGLTHTNNNRKRREKDFLYLCSGGFARSSSSYSTTARQSFIYTHKT